MTYEHEARGDIHVFTLKKDLTGGDETTQIENALQAIMSPGSAKIVIDLGRISYLNSAGLGSLVTQHTSATNKGGWIRLARINKRIKSLFLVTKLTFVFDTYDSVEEAIDGKNKADA